MERNDIGCLQECLEIDRRGPNLREALWRDVRIVGEDPHLEGAQTPCDLGTDLVRPRKSIGRMCFLSQRPARVDISATTI
jgi:hypothetical protein